MSEFTDAIEANWPDYMIAAGASATCSECTDGDEIDPDDQEALQAYDEGHFSRWPCDSCDSTLAGDRHNAHAIHKEAFGPDAKRPGDVHHLNICVDCLLFHANGDEPENWHPR